MERKRRRLIKEKEVAAMYKSKTHTKPHRLSLIIYPESNRKKNITKVLEKTRKTSERNKNDIRNQLARETPTAFDVFHVDLISRFSPQKISPIKKL